MLSALNATLLMLMPSFLFDADVRSEAPFFGTIQQDSTVPDSDYVFINSPGGLVYKSFEMVPQLEGKTCIVFNAASAALMIILPACKERYYVPNARLGFHSAVFFLMWFELNQWNAQEAASALAEANQQVLFHMIGKGVPFTPDVLQYHMQQNTVFDAETINVWEPWILPVEQCKHCPDWTKTVQLKPASPKPSTTSEDGKGD